MGTAIICLIIVIICVLGIKSYTKRLTSGCCGGGGDAVKKTKPKDTDISHYPYTSKILITGMTCKNCARRIENAFHELDGVWAEANAQKGYAVVHMKEKMDDAELRRIVSRTGYGVESVETL